VAADAGGFAAERRIPISSWNSGTKRACRGRADDDIPMAREQDLLHLLGITGRATLPFCVMVLPTTWLILWFVCLLYPACGGPVRRYITAAGRADSSFFTTRISDRYGIFCWAVNNAYGLICDVVTPSAGYAKALLPGVVIGFSVCRFSVVNVAPGCASIRGGPPPSSSIFSLPYAWFLYR